MARKCVEEEVDGISDFMTLMTASTVNLVCNDLEEDSEKCTRLTTPKKPKGIARPKSFLFPFIDILNSLPDEREQK